MRAGKTRQIPIKKRRLGAKNDHFEEDVNAVFPSAIVFQQPVKGLAARITHCESLVTCGFNRSNRFRNYRSQNITATRCNPDNVFNPNAAETTVRGQLIKRNK